MDMNMNMDMDMNTNTNTSSTATNKPTKGVTFGPGVTYDPSPDHSVSSTSSTNTNTNDRNNTNTASNRHHLGLYRENSFFPDDMTPAPAASPHHPKAGGMISPAEYAPRKLGTWDGVFMPVSLNILGIILFLRFGFIIGQVGLLGAFFLMVISYTIDALTAMSLNAISTNGQVRGGGAYYLISRSLGPEFGGSIGLIFFAGQALNAAMNVLGFVESLTDAYGESRMHNGLPEGGLWLFFYGSLLLLLCMLVCLVGSRLFARATLGLAVILSVSILSIPLSSFVVHPFQDPERGAYFTSWSWSTLRANLLPHFTTGAAGSSTGDNPESWQSVFGVLFPAVNGILAGASMSGDLRKPSKSIPKGTNWSLAFTFFIYATTFLILAATVDRSSFYLDAGIVNDIALSPQLITFGALASTAFSALMGVLACAKVLQAIARDNLLPVLNTFAQGTEVSDTPTYAILLTYVFCQLVLVVDSVNALAQLVTMTTLLTFGTLCFATAALKAGGAPSFRPSFRYWNIWTASGGTLISFGAMFFTDWWAALECLVLTFGLFVAVHIYAPPKPWGDVTRNLNYYISRRQMLRIDERKGHVKYWRPQVLLLANNPRTEWNTIIFCNSLKKGSLYVLGHVLKGDFAECLSELKRQNIAWLKLIDLTGIKSFVDIVIARDEREGARNLILSCGLGGMRPNIVVMGFPTHMQFPARIDTARQKQQHLVAGSDESEITIRGLISPVDESDEADCPQGYTALDVDELPTDHARRETPIRAQAFVGIMEDTLALHKSFAVAYGFSHLDTVSTAGLHPRRDNGSWFSSFFSRNNSNPSPAEPADKQKKYLDLWPVQIASSEPGSYDQSHAWDTYTMVLHLGTILSMTGAWKRHHLRVNVFVELPEEREEERGRICSLLDNLRVRAELRVFCLRTCQVSAYNAIVLGQPASERIERALEQDSWWESLKELRKEDERRARRAAALAAKRKFSSGEPGSGAASAAAAAAGAPSTSRSGSSGGSTNQTTSPSRQQTKRQQDLLGFTLPPEHMAYFKRNIQIGLAHPKARLRRTHAFRSDGTGSESDSESSSSSSGSSSGSSSPDSDGDLSDELYHLLDEEHWATNGAAGGGGRSHSSIQHPGTGVRRSRTFNASGYGGGGWGKRHRARSHSMSVSAAASIPGRRRTQTAVEGRAVGGAAHPAGPPVAVSTPGQRARKFLALAARGSTPPLPSPLDGGTDGRVEHSANSSKRMLNGPGYSYNQGSGQDDGANTTLNNNKNKNKNGGADRAYASYGREGGKSGPRRRASSESSSSSSSAEGVHTRLSDHGAGNDDIEANPLPDHHPSFAPGPIPPAAQDEVREGHLRSRNMPYAAPSDRDAHPASGSASSVSASTSASASASASVPPAGSTTASRPSSGYYWSDGTPGPAWGGGQPLISFNELPNKAQYLILNELICTYSSVAGGTSIVLTALPPPEPGTAEDELKSLRYLKLLHTLFAGGPPVLGVHAKTMTAQPRT